MHFAVSVPHSQLLDIQIDSEDERDILRSLCKPKRGRARRPRDQLSKCGCGNLYSCSSALSLHIKIKHGGKVPEGSVGFPSGNYRRRDRSARLGGQSQASTNCSQQVETIHAAKAASFPEQTAVQSQSYQISTREQLANHIQFPQPNNSTDQLALQQDHEFTLNFQLDDQFDSLADGQRKEQNNDSNSQDIDHLQRRRSGYRRKYKSGNREYVSKRLYLCGGCPSHFGFLEELMLHINKSHEGDIPDGSIFGLKREALLRFFHIPAPKPNTNRRYYIFRCGCGKEYSCSSSLYYHIKTVHGGSEPPGTYGMAKQP